MKVTREQWIKVLPFLLMLVVSLALAFGLLEKESDSSDKKTISLVGDQIPLFSLSFWNMPPQPFDFSPQIFQGSVVMINVFGSWCKPCAVEHPVLMKLAATGKVNMVGIAWRDTEDAVTEYLKKHGNPYKLVGMDEAGQVTVPLGLTGVPETFIIDRQGVVIYHTNQPITEEVAMNTILPLIEKVTAEQPAPVKEE
jgi:cytochrome c biogenesis protein CcmG/thiol:disulfide interchange protein DsbE